MDLEQALRDLTDALAAGEGARSRDATMRGARHVLASRCAAMLHLERPEPSITTVIRLAVETQDRNAQGACALLLLHALAARGLIPGASANDMCALAERALRSALLRCDYPFNGSTEDKMRVLERLHRTIGELLQPLEPTFPNWQGLYAG